VNFILLNRVADLFGSVFETKVKKKIDLSNNVHLRCEHRFINSRKAAKYVDAKNRLPNFTGVFL